MAGNFPMNVYNNMIVNNVSTHEGGGIALDDAPNVRVYNNTIMKNLTTATAVTSNGQPGPGRPLDRREQRASAAGDAAGAGSPPASATRCCSTTSSGTTGRAPASGGTVIGIGAAGDATPINHWDLGALDGSVLLAPTNSIVQQSAGTHPYTTSPTNQLAATRPWSLTYDTALAFAPWRTNPNFVGAILVAVDLPPSGAGRLPPRRHLVAGVQRRGGQQGRAPLPAAAGNPVGAYGRHRRPSRPTDPTGRPPGVRCLRHGRGRVPMKRRARATRSTVAEGDNEMTDHGRLLLSRRQVLKSEGSPRPRGRGGPGAPAGGDDPPAGPRPRG